MNITPGDDLMLIVISGPSGVGKGTVCKKVSKLTGIRIAISATSREQRKGEKAERDYYFINEDEFKLRIERGDFLEYAVVYGHYYGTLKTEVAEGDVILEIDTQGAMKVLKNNPEVLSIFLLPPSMEELRNRIEKRGREPKEAIEARLKAAEAEIDIGKRRYKHVVTNDDSSKAAKEIADIIKQAESL